MTSAAATTERPGRPRIEPTVLQALRSPRLLTREVLAGIVVAVALIPESIAFSIIAGVDPRVGLFSSFIMAVSIAFLGGRPAMISAATGAVALVIAPFVAYPVFVMKVLCFALFALAFNLLLGYGGLLSFGHAAYFGMASYVSAYTAKNWGLTPELAILLGTAVGAVLGLVFGALAIRRQGIYFAMITLALAQMVFFFSLQTPRFTGGEDGIQAVPRASSSASSALPTTARSTGSSPPSSWAGCC